MGETPLFRVAAGPRIGFGHLVRTVSLCRALDARPIVALRGGQTARSVARRLGCALVDLAPQMALRRRAPSVLVVDDPSAEAACAWVAAARRQRIPVAAIRDRGFGARGVDLAVDGSLCAPSTRRDRQQLLGPRFMVLDPVFSRTRIRPSRRATDGRVVITLGGGVHAGYAMEVVAILQRVLGPRYVDVAPGFAIRRRAAMALLRTGPAHARRLARAEVALVSGGVGLYEVSCLGIPAVAVAVTSEQHQTVKAFAAAGAVVDGGMLRCTGRARGRAADRLAARVLGLLGDQAARMRLASRARRVVDGRGGVRVAAAVRSLVASGASGGGGAA